MCDEGTRVEGGFVPGGERVAHGDTLAGELHSWGDRFGAWNKGE